MRLLLEVRETIFEALCAIYTTFSNPPDKVNITSTSHYWHGVPHRDWSFYPDFFEVHL